MKATTSIIIICFSIICLLSCVSQSRLKTSTDFQQFDNAFAQQNWTDTLDSRKTDWAKGYSYEIKTPILKNELFYAVFDTSEMTYRYWEDRIYAEAKIDLPNKQTGYFVSRQTEDITYDRTTVLVIVDKDYNYVQDFVFSEFIGYEGYITETQSQLNYNTKMHLVIHSYKNESYFDYEKEEQIENEMAFRKVWLNNQFYPVDSGVNLD